MNYEKFGIGITFVILLSVVGFAGLSSGDFIEIPTLDLSLEQNSPTSNTSKDGYYEWCYRMGYTDC